ncbi:hypothetical protein HK100_008038 [Physocladia obscura]|uniref:Uncharacterized protein n=1 Tax=Physocladia obscura TaxID=109957 RepID=A0AAD5SNL5_9FUNG|nr:hypothetical protein HK100_008038 [Physocladia obscura]
MISIEDFYAQHPEERPTRPSAHPFLLIKQEAVTREVGDDDCIHKELYVHNNKDIDGVFISKEDADFLGLVEIGNAETVYGSVVSLPVNNVYKLPSEFSGTHLGEGIIGIRVLHSLGVSVAYDRGFVYLLRNGFEKYVLGGDKPGPLTPPIGGGGGGGGTEESRIEYPAAAGAVKSVHFGGLGIVGTSGLGLGIDGDDDLYLQEEGLFDVDDVFDSDD